MPWIPDRGREVELDDEVRRVGMFELSSLLLLLLLLSRSWSSSAVSRLRVVRTTRRPMLALATGGVVFCNSRPSVVVRGIEGPQDCDHPE